MKNRGKYIIIALISVVIIILIWAISSYNGIVSARENIENGMSDINVQYKRRADLIPNLVESVKGYSAHEETIIDNIVKARQGILNSDTLKEKASYDAELTSAIKSLNINVENYPNLKADSTYLSLMDELSGTENRIAIASEDYNKLVRNYNNKIIRFPGSIVANFANYEKV